MNFRRFSPLVGLSCASLLASAPAAAAARVPQAASYSPWAALSAFASPASSQALCGSSAAGAAASMAANAAQGAPGCVLPATDAPVPPPQAEAAPLGAPAPIATGNGFAILPLLAGLAVVGGLAALLLSNDEDEGDLIAISPA
ncbi:hypothetical protein [Sphingomonas sp. LHG3406-1]|uniref:hypothetical protein n=1 Tax=Sphingomonas sp. LHG3406-1 TaxID=2804617 RepID=UPI002637EF30|nr:hypothetical protein [Sphingomonas sp. LHG3406-1]